MGVVVSFRGGAVEGSAAEPDGDLGVDVPSAEILQTALDDGVEDVLVVGYDRAGKLYFASAYADSGDLMVMLVRAQRMLLDALDP